MKNFNIKIADQIFNINSDNEEIFNMCKDYIVEDGKPVESISIENEENIGKAFSLMYQKIGDYLIKENSLIIHGASIEYKNKGYIFIGPSGTGKSTHINYWINHLKDLTVINGDKPIVKVGENNSTIYGSPWCGKERLGTNTNCILDSIVILKRGSINRILEVSPKEHIEDIINEIYIPGNNLLNIVDLLNKLFKTCRLYVMECQNTDEAFYVAYKKLTGEIYEG